MMRSLNPESYSIVASLLHDIQHVQVVPKISTSGYLSFASVITLGDGGGSPSNMKKKVKKCDFTKLAIL